MVLLDGPLLRVTNLFTPDSDVKMSVHCVLVGLGRLMRDYRGVRKHPNVVFRVHAEKGPNDGFVEVVVRTHNACGIASGSELVADFGEHYVPPSVPQTENAKRFKGALDVWLSKHAQTTEEERTAAAVAGGNALGAGGGGAGGVAGTDLSLIHI